MESAETVNLSKTVLLSLTLIQPVKRHIGIHQERKKTKPNHSILSWFSADVSEKKLGSKTLQRSLFPNNKKKLSKNLTFPKWWILDWIMWNVKTKRKRKINSCADEAMWGQSHWTASVSHPCLFNSRIFKVYNTWKTLEINFQDWIPS